MKRSNPGSTIRSTWRPALSENVTWAAKARPDPTAARLGARGGERWAGGTGIGGFDLQAFPCATCTYKIVDRRTAVSDVGVKH